MTRDELRCELQRIIWRKAPSLRDCARDTTVSKSTIARFLSGKPIRAATLEKLAQWARDQEQSK